MQVLPVIIDTLTRNTGPSQTDRIEGIDLNVSKVRTRKTDRIEGIDLNVSKVQTGKQTE